MSDLPSTDLASDSVETRRAACTAIADAVDAGTPLDGAVEAVIAALADPDPPVQELALYILQTDAERDPAGRSVEGLRAALTSEIDGVRRSAAFLLAGFLARQEQGAAVAALIATPDRLVRLGTLKALADGALPRAGTDAVVAALVSVLADDDLGVRKEAIWALYLLGSERVSLEPALPALERAIADATTQGNAAIALSLAWHTANDAARADALYASPSGVVQMGAAWGAADHALRAGDKAALARLFSSENDSVRRGLGAFLHHARTHGRDITLAGQTFSELETAHPADALLHARLYAVLEIAKHGPAA